jgi:peroxiredoxin
VTVSGKNQEYAHETITFNIYENFITGNENKIAVVTADSTGAFSFKVNISETEFVFAHIGREFLYIYLEPEKTYNINLPPKTIKTQDEILNPYFEEIRKPFTINYSKFTNRAGFDEKSKELNFLIRSFDNTFDPIYADYSIKVYSNSNSSILDSLIRRIDSIFNENSNPYFKDYINYKIGLLKFMSTKFKSRNISDTYFLNKSVLYRNPAFMALFNQVYDKYFVYFGRTQSGKIIYDDIDTRKSLASLRITLAQDKVLSNDTLKDLVILKGIHDGCYEMDFSRNGLIQILDSIIITSHITMHRVVAKDIRDKVTRLLPGYPPPAFKLLNQDSIWVSLSSFKDTMVYIIFCTTQNYSCFKEYDQLKKIQQKHGDILKIVTISVDESLSYIRNFTKKYAYNWTFLYYGDQPDILKDYDIRTIPTYYLVGPDGKLIMSPAPAPSEQFEMYLFEYMKGKHLL